MKLNYFTGKDNKHNDVGTMRRSSSPCSATMIRHPIQFYLGLHNFHNLVTSLEGIRAKLVVVCDDLC